MQTDNNEGVRMRINVNEINTRKSLRFASLLALVLALALLGSCGFVTQGSEAIAEVPDGFIMVTDSLGREVYVPINPRYVATVHAPITHFVTMLGGADTIVAVASGNTRDVLFVEMFPDILNARQPRGNNMINLEELFKDPVPQIVFLDEVSVRDERVLQNIEAFGVPVVAVGFNSIEELMAMTTMVGQIMGGEEIAAAYNAHLTETLAMITQRIGNMPDEDKRVVYHAVNELLRTNVANSLAGEWMPKMGIIPAVSVMSDDPINNNRHFVGLEELLQLDPEYIIINGADVYDYIHSPRGERLHVLSAFQNDNIYLLPMGISRWAHHNSLETPLAMKWLAQLVHPDLFEDIDMVEEIKDFYRRFFDYELSRETVELILDGRTFRDWRSFQNRS